MSKVRYGMQKEFDNWLQDIRTPLEWKPGARVELLHDLTCCPARTGDKGTVLDRGSFCNDVFLIEFDKYPGKHDLHKARFKLIR